MESVGRAGAVGRGIGERINDLQLFDDRPWPPVRDDQRQGIFVLRTNVNEMNVEAIDLGDELRQGVQFRLALAPIVICCPVTREFLNHRERHALRVVADRFPFGPPCRLYALAQFVEFVLRKADFERADCFIRSRRLRLRGEKTGSRHSDRGGKNLATVGGRQLR